MLNITFVRHLTVFYRSNAAVVGSNPARGMNVCVRILCVGSDVSLCKEPYRV
jgi:hypothetical protein